MSGYDDLADAVPNLWPDRSASPRTTAQLQVNRTFIGKVWDRRPDRVMKHGNPRNLKRADVRLRNFAKED